jgi:hypothetical protein
MVVFAEITKKKIQFIIFYVEVCAESKTTYLAIRKVSFIVFFMFLYVLWVLKLQISNVLLQIYNILDIKNILKSFLIVNFVLIQNDKKSEPR